MLIAIAGLIASIGAIFYVSLNFFVKTFLMFLQSFSAWREHDMAIYEESVKSWNEKNRAEFEDLKIYVGIPDKTTE